RRRLRLVQALQRAVVALVEPPVLAVGQPGAVEVLEHDGQGADGPLEQRGEAQVEVVSALAQQARRLVRFLHALRAQVHVRPSREPVLQVPRALAVPEQHQRLHECLPSAPTMRVCRASAIARSNDRKMRSRPCRFRHPAPANTRMGCGRTPARMTLIAPSFNRRTSDCRFTSPVASSAGTAVMSSTTTLTPRRSSRAMTLSAFWA